MEKSFEEFQNEYLDDIHINSCIESTTFDDYFLNDFLNKLSSMGEIVDPQIVMVNKKGKNGRIMSFDAFSFDDSDKSIILITSDYVDSIGVSLTKTDIEKYKSRMLAFLDEAINNRLDLYFDITDDSLKLGKEIGNRLKIDYVQLDEDKSLDKIKLYIITNKVVPIKLSSLSQQENFLGKKVEMNIWNLQRLYDLFKSGQSKEPIIIDVKKYGIEGIPCIKAQMVDNLDYDAYLAIVPGLFLSEIYYEHGSRLLEGNVRAFLSIRGKINKGIRETIRTEPTKFFAYNNGIACTASSIVLSQDGHQIIRMDNLQIINGGQTTASLNSAIQKDKMSLDNIFIPMKLTVVKDNEEYDTIIQNISKYANSQNKVTDADLFSNHPFHRKFEILSKKVSAPPKEGEIFSSFWYYERARGKYEQEQFRIVRKSEKDIFLKKYPKTQVVKKEELAKYFNTAQLLRPDIVSKGSQKNMQFFATYIDEKFKQTPEEFNESFYKLCICYAILFRKTDYLISKATWYNVGGYKLNIIPYTISKLISCIPIEYTLDFDLIWKKQDLYPSLRKEIEKLAEITNQFIIDSKGVIVTEYCKKEDTWKKYRSITYQLSEEFIKDLVPAQILKERISAYKKEEKISIQINIETEIFNLGGQYWQKLIDEGTKRRLLSPMEIDLLGIAASIDTLRPRIPSPKQAKLIWKIREKLDKAGVLV